MGQRHLTAWQVALVQEAPRPPGAPCSGRDQPPPPARPPPHSSSVSGGCCSCPRPCPLPPCVPLAGARLPAGAVLPPPCPPMPMPSVGEPAAEVDGRSWAWRRWRAGGKVQWQAPAAARRGAVRVACRLVSADVVCAPPPPSRPAPPPWSSALMAAVPQATRCLTSGVQARWSCTPFLAAALLACCTRRRFSTPCLRLRVLHPVSHATRWGAQHLCLLACSSAAHAALAKASAVLPERTRTAAPTGQPNRMRLQMRCCWALPTAQLARRRTPARRCRAAMHFAVLRTSLGARWGS